MLGKLLALSFVAQAAAYCATGTGGTCKHLGCSSKHGPTDCESGTCVCQDGFCATIGTCYKQDTCHKDTGGTCSMFGCKSWRGDTECHDGKCKCSGDGCVLGDTGICSPKCEKNTGGSCSMFGCKSSRGPTECEGGVCKCKHGYCASKGVCYPHKGGMTETFSNMTELPAFWLDDALVEAWSPESTAGACAAFACFASIMVVLGVVAWRRHGKNSDLPGYSESLLPEETVSS